MKAGATNEKILLPVQHNSGGAQADAFDWLEPLTEQALTLSYKHQVLYLISQLLA